jgi:succinyl-CoA synthetase beta subunit
MHLHEFLAKELLSRRGVRIPRGQIAGSADEAALAARELMLPARQLNRQSLPSDRQLLVLKAQVRAGSRGPAGGVRTVESAAEAALAASELIGKRLVTAQTGQQGETVRWVYLEEAVAAVARLYVAAVLDRSAGCLMLLAAASDAQDVEKASAAQPGLMRKLPLRLAGKRAAGDFARFAREVLPQAADDLAALMEAIANAAVELDATLIEIHPLALAVEGQLVALDAKITIDDNALFRHPDLATVRQMNDAEEGDSILLDADRHQINYVALEGDIGVVANGAGLALATLDMLADAGGRPANFMDIRTTASSLDVAYGFEVLLSNPKVRAVLVNVHGGGMQRCDTIAEGIGISLRRKPSAVPIVVRLAGNNADFARQRLQSFGIRFSEGRDMADAARRAVALVSREAA